MSITQQPHTMLPSAHQIGDEVKLVFMPGASLSGSVTAVHFTISKVKYDIELRLEEDQATRIYNVDSAFVNKVE